MRFLDFANILQHTFEVVYNNAFDLVARGFLTNKKALKEKFEIDSKKKLSTSIFACSI